MHKIIYDAGLILWEGKSWILIVDTDPRIDLNRFVKNLNIFTSRMVIVCRL